MNKFVAKSEQVKTAEDARQLAIDWQIWAGQEALSFSEVIEWHDLFEKLGKKYNLTEEFKENGIL